MLEHTRVRLVPEADYLACKQGHESLYYLSSLTVSTTPKRQVGLCTLLFPSRPALSLCTCFVSTTPRPITAYKRKNVRDGPIRVCPAPLNANAIATGSSTSGSGTEQQKSASAPSPKPHLTTRTALDTSPSATNEGGEIGNTTPAASNEGGKTCKTVSHFQGKPLLNRLLVAEQNSVSKGKGKARDISK
jgi:hypothetical protein